MSECFDDFMIEEQIKAFNKQHEEETRVDVSEKWNQLVEY